jgi:malonyl-CoA/methylmalonyl-CoA synthetase
MTNSNANVYAHFANSYSNTRDKVVLATADGHQLSFSDLDKLSAQIARHLLNLGAQTGDRITVQINKSAQSLALYFACLRAGLVYHPLNLGYKKAELEYFIANAEPSIIVCDSGNKVESLKLQKHAQIISKRLSTARMTSLPCCTHPVPPVYPRASCSHTAIFFPMPRH